ncbi:MAG: PfkB family carbohydrate kinase [Thermoguttaceae bacterium]|jgi:cytidyltransferase-like protein
MKKDLQRKIVPLAALTGIVQKRHAAAQVVVQSHGVFDLIHPGILNHLQQARRQGDLLIVTVIKDKDVRRGPGRPVFTEAMRAMGVAALEPVDYVCVVDDDPPLDCVRRIRPDVLARGQPHAQRDPAAEQQILKVEQDLRFERVRVHHTTGLRFDWSRLREGFLDLYPAETRHFLGEFARRYSSHELAAWLEGMQDLRVLVVGDAIIDEYCYCSPLAKSAKSQVVATKYQQDEAFAGGIFAIANHLSGLCDRVDLVTLLGREDSREEFARNHLRQNVGTKFFYRPDGPTTIKRRYIHQGQKLFEINYINDNDIGPPVESEISEYLAAAAPRYDLVLVSNFGHGFLTAPIIRTLERGARYLAVNAQINAANTGFNLITKFGRPRFVCLDEAEARLATQNRFGPPDEVAQQLVRRLEPDCLIVTLGKKGSVGIDRGGQINFTPVFSAKVVDTVGAGDTFFSFAALCAARGLPLEVTSFVGNAVGALAVQIVGNKRPVEKYELLELVHSLLASARSETALLPPAGPRPRRRRRGQPAAV